MSNEGNDEDKLPSLEEIYKNQLSRFLSNARSMMVDNHEPGDELHILLTVRRVDSEQNLWDVVFESEDESEMCMNTIDASQFSKASELSKEIAKMAGVEFGEEETDSGYPTKSTPDSPAFR